METGGYAPLVVRRGIEGLARTNADTRKWTFARSSLVHLRQSGAVSDLSFSPLAQQDVAAACGPVVSVVDSQAGIVRRTLARFRDVAHSPDYKPDGRLLVAGCDSGTVQVFDLSSRAILRIFKGHNGAVHSTRFTGDGLRVMAACDDGIARAWDMGTSKLLFSLKGATDYVRAQAGSPSSRHIWATGSYDRRARIYDLRTRKTLFTLDHGYQVDSVLLLPGGSRAVTLGGPEVKVWDFFAGGRMMACLRNHAKAVTCGVVNPDGEKLLTGGLDGLVKVHDLATLDLVSSMSFGGQVLSLAVAPQGNRVAVGLVDGSVDIRASRKALSRTFSAAQDADGKEIDVRPGVPNPLKERMFEGWGRGFEKPRARDVQVGSMRYYVRGQHEGVTDDRDVVVRRRRRTGLKQYDLLLKKFSYGEALDSVLVSRWNSRNLSTAASLLEELVVRNSLTVAVGGRTAEQLEPILSLISSAIVNPRYSLLMMHVLSSVLDLYGDVFGIVDKGDSVDGLLYKIRCKVRREIVLLRDLMSIQGMIEMLPGPAASSV